MNINSTSTVPAIWQKGEKRALFVLKEFGFHENLDNNCNNKHAAHHARGGGASGSRYEAPRALGQATEDQRDHPAMPAAPWVWGQEGRRVRPAGRLRGQPAARGSGARRSPVGEAPHLPCRPGFTGNPEGVRWA